MSTWQNHKQFDTYLKAFEKMLDRRGYREGLPNTPEEVFDAWLSESWKVIKEEK